MTNCTKGKHLAISMVRGDSATFHFHREDADGSIITTAPTAIYFTVKASFEDESFVFQKTLEDMTIDDRNEYHFTIDPADTNGLDFGDYVYDLEVIRNEAATDKQTIAKGLFRLETEVTYASNEEAA